MDDNLINSEIEAPGGAAWAKHFFPHIFTRPFTSYQKAFWEWGWQIEAGRYYRPRIECHPRGVGKSSNAEALVCSFIARQKRKMIGYVGLDEDKATKHFDAVKSMLESESLLRAYPHCRPQMQKLRNAAAQWSRNAIVTHSGAMVVPLSLQGSSRGWKSPVGNRFDAIILDDLDQLGMSVNLIRKFLELLKGEILAAGDDNTLVIMPQNLVHRDSICAQILDHRADILSDREFCGPFPLLKSYEAEKRDLPDGAKCWVITAGEPLDPAIDIKYAEKLLNKFGKATFDKECHPAGVRIRTANRGLIPIEDIKEGEQVVTHLGRIRNVTELLKREYTGELVSIRRGGKTEWLQATASHPLFVARRPEHNIWYKDKGRRNLEALKYEWAGAESIKKDDFLLEPIPQEPESFIDNEIIWEFKEASCGRPPQGHKQIIATPELFRLIGYYLAEGGVYDRRISLTFHEDEIEYYEDVERIFRRVFNVGIYTRPSHGRSIEVSVSSAIPREFFKWIGTGSKKKIIPDFVTRASNKLIQELLIGYFRGDGCKDPSGFAYNTTSEQLAEGIRLLLLRLGIVGGVYKLRSRVVSLPQGLYERSEHWQGDINGGFAKKLAEILGETHETCGNNNYTFIHKGYAHYGVKEIKNESVENLAVYNFEVEEDHSYIVDGVSSHNCQQRVFEVEEDKDFREWNEAFHIITHSEFLQAMRELGEPVWNESRQHLQIPQRWNVGIGFDWGSTRKHPAAIAFVARPSQNSPLKDCHFVFAEVVRPKFPGASGEEPEAVSPGRVAQAINEVLKSWNVYDSQIKMRLMSHEASAALNTMAIDLKEDIRQFFNKWKAQKGSGVPQIQNLLEIDRQKLHPFRRYPARYYVNGKDLGGQRLTGRPRLFFIVADGQGELRVDLNGELYVAGPRDAEGLARARFELPLYNHRESGQRKIDDDFTDGFRGLMARFGVEADPKTVEERVSEAADDQLPTTYLEQVAETAPARFAAALTARIAIENRIRQQIMSEDDPAEFGSDIG